MRAMQKLAAALSVTAAIGGCTSLLGDFSLTPQSGGGDGGNEAGGGSDGSLDADNQETSSGDGGDAGKLQCALITKYQRPIPPDGGAVSPQDLWVFSTTGSSAIGGVKGNNGNGDSFAFYFRSDRLENAQTMPILQRAATIERSYDDMATYAIGLDQGAPDGGALNTFQWNDNNGTFGGGPPFQTASFPPNMFPQTVDITSTPSGVFYAMSINPSPSPAAVYVSLGSAALTTQVSNVDDTGIGDGGRLYTLTDGSVSLIVYKVTTNGLEAHQMHFPAGSTTADVDRVFPGGSNTHPIGFSRHSSGVADVALAIFNDAGTNLDLYTGAIDESKLFTFTVADLKALPASALSINPSSKPCFSMAGGKFTAIAPNPTAGFDMLIIDTATASVSYSLKGTANLLPGETDLLECAVSPPRVSFGTTAYDFVWTSKSGSASLLNYAPLDCTK